MKVPYWILRVARLFVRSQQIIYGLPFHPKLTRMTVSEATMLGTLEVQVFAKYLESQWPVIWGHFQLIMGYFGL